MKARFILSLSATTCLLGSALCATTPDEDAVLTPIKAMFDGMTKRDAAAILDPVLPGATMVLMRDGKATQMTVQAFADRVGKPGKTHIEERIHDPLVRIDNDLAMVWAPLTSLSTATSTTAARTSSTSFARMDVGSSRLWPTRAEKIVQRSSSVRLRVYSAATIEHADNTLRNTTRCCPDHLASSPDVCR